MKTVLSNSQIDTCGLATIKQLHIKATPEAFRQLSSGLYSDKISAIIRELSTNAIDSHKAANNPEPFIVQLPNEFDPEFSVRDFGTGLSEEDTTNLYCTYFETNKNHSNDAIGCFGLGAKSPFSYTDSFSTTTYFNGIKTVFNLFIDENQIPVIAKFSEEETDEPNGLKIAFPVKKADFSLFKEKARNIFQWFDQKPTITGCHDFTFASQSDYLYEDTLTIDIDGIPLEFHYGIPAKKDSSRIIMGNISYPLNTGNVNYKFSNELGAGIYLFLPLGTVVPTPSRESISFTQESINLVCKILGSVKETISSKLEETLNNSPNLWDLRCLMNELDKGRFTSFLKRKEMPEIAWNGEDINCKYDFPSDVTFWKMENRNGTRKKLNSYCPSPADYIFVNDAAHGGYAAVKREREKIRNEKMKNNTLSDLGEFYIVTGDYSQVVEELGLDYHKHTIYTSNIPKKPRSKITVPSGVYQWNGRSWVSATELSTDGLYVECYHSQFRFDENEEFRSLPMHEIVALFKIDVPIYSVTKSQRRVAKKLTNLGEFISECIDEYISENNIDEQIIVNNLIKSRFEQSQYDFYIKNFQEAMRAGISSPAPNSEFNECIDEIDRVRSIQQDAKLVNYMKYMDCSRWSQESNKLFDEFNNKLRNAYEKYFLFRFFDNNAMFKKHMVIYLGAIDEQS